MFNKRAVKQHEIATLIGATTTISGNVEFSGGLRVDGTVKGMVRCADGDKGGMLVVSESGRIEGEVRAGHLVVAGYIDGPVVGTQLIEIQAKARIVGDVQYRAVEIHHGAIVEGRLIHISADGKSEVRVDQRTDTKANLKLAVKGDAVKAEPVEAKLSRA